MMIHKDKCAELRLPAPSGHETQLAYILRSIAAGYVLNTRMCRYIGIHNLHSLASTLASRGIQFTLLYERAYCPFMGNIPSHPVDVIYMTQEQQTYHLNKKTSMA